MTTELSKSLYEVNIILSFNDLSVINPVEE